MFLPGNYLQRAVILDFKPRLGHRCSAIAAAAKNGPPAECPWRTQAGTGCHEGGIILNKKPPEWRPVPAASRGQSRTPSPRRFPWSASGPISLPLPVVSLVPILPPQWYPASIRVGENCATPQRFLPLHYRCPCPMVRNGGSTGSTVSGGGTGSAGSAGSPEAPEGSEKSEGIG